MKPCFPLFRCSRDPHCRARFGRIDRGRAKGVCVYWNFCVPSGLGKTKQKNGSRCARNRLIIRLFVDGGSTHGRFLHKNPGLVVPCLPIPFTGWSAVNYSRGALRRIYTARSWRSSRINQPKWMHCTRTRFCLDFLKRKRGRIPNRKHGAFLINNDKPLSIL